jgi:hypothetical protein
VNREGDRRMPAWKIAQTGRSGECVVRRAVEGGHSQSAHTSRAAIRYRGNTEGHGKSYRVQAVQLASRRPWCCAARQSAGRGARRRAKTTAKHMQRSAQFCYSGGSSPTLRSTVSASSGTTTRETPAPLLPNGLRQPPTAEYETVD